MNKENQSLVTYEPVEVQDFEKITHHSRGYMENILQINKENLNDHNM